MLWLALDALFQSKSSDAIEATYKQKKRNIAITSECCVFSFFPALIKL